MKNNSEKFNQAAVDFDILFEKIIAGIEEERKISRARRRLAVFSVLAAILAVSLAPAVKIVWQASENSGLWQFFSLIFSDFGTVAASWQNFVLLILEATPVMSLALFFAIVFGFLELLRFLAKDSKIVFESRSANIKYGHQ